MNMGCLPEVSLLDALAMMSRCMYLSDLRNLSQFDRTRLARKLETLPSDAASLDEWNDALEYLAKDYSPRTRAEEARAALIAGLQM